MAISLTGQLAKLQVAFEPGQPIIHEGDASTDVFLLMKGRAMVLKGETPIRELSAEGGDMFFGEIAHLLGQNRTASVVASTSCVVIKIPGKALFRVLSSSPSLMQRLLSQLAHRVLQQDPERVSSTVSS